MYIDVIFSIFVSTFELEFCVSLCQCCELTLAEQCLDNVFVSDLSSEGQWSKAIGTAGVGPGPSSQQLLHKVLLPQAGSLMQGSPAVRPLQVDVGTHTE